MGLDYKKSGVDVEAGYEAVSLMKGHVASTMRPEVLTDIGGFGGLFSLGAQQMTHPVLVSGTDGVGTKLKLAFALDRHDTIGVDCVAMCVNDVVCSGAEPLFFLDYIALGKNVPQKVADIVAGVADGCRQAGCALIGGETAEMPGFYQQDEYDLAGFTVGVVEKNKIIDGQRIKAGDVLLGLPSSGVHSNGFSLVRKVFEPIDDHLNTHFDILGTTLGEALLAPTRIYVKTILKLKELVNLKGIAHITGGGFIENIPRILPEGLGVTIDGQWPVLPIFKLLQEKGGITSHDMFNTFNMGIGMVLAVDADDEQLVKNKLANMGEDVYTIGRVTAGSGVTLCLS